MLGRLLGPGDYGKYGVVLNLAWVTGIPFGAVVASLIKFSAEFNAKRDYGRLKSVLFDFLKFSLVLNLIFVFVYIIFSNILSNALGGDIGFFIIILACSFPLSGLGSVLLNFLQGIGRTYSFSFITSVSTLFKLIFAVLLVMSGFGIFGAFLSLVISSVCVIILCLPFIWRYFKVKNVSVESSLFLRFGLPVLFTNLFLNLVLYFDLFFVSSFLGSEQAGFYNAAVTLSRAFLMSSSVMVVFFPMFSGDAILSNFKRLRNNLKLALFYTGCICLVGILAFWFFPDFIVNLTYSSKYLPAVPLLRVLSFGYSFYALFTVLVYALWSLNKHKLVGIFGIILFTLDVCFLYFLVPVYGILGAAWVTTGILGTLFFFALFFVFSHVFKA